MSGFALNPRQAKWLRNRWRMYRWPRPRRVQGDFYQSTLDLDAVMEFFHARPGSFDGLPETTGYLEGRCYVCSKASRFEAGRLPTEETINWRESLVCPDCGLSNRLRSSIHLFEELVRPEEDDLVYITESVTPLCHALSSRHPGVWSSEYSSEHPLGLEFDTPFGEVYNQDVTQLTFCSRKFHALLSFDVLEHVPDYKTALAEFHRVLATGGQLLLSVPFLFGDETRKRAAIDAQGNVEHLLEPVYHGDPVNQGGVLCFYEFGMDLLADMRAAGFQQAFAVCYYAPEWGYVSPQVLFVGRKRT